MPKTNRMETDLLELVFKNAVTTTVSFWEDLSDGVAKSTTDGSVYVSLHTSDDGTQLEGGSQTTNEATWAGATPYDRVAVARGAGWTLAGNQVSNASTVAFPQKQDAGTVTVRYFGIGTDTLAAGAGNLLYWGPLALSDSFPYTVTTADLFTAPGHGLVNGDQAVHIDVIGGTPPTGVTKGTYYFAVGVSGDTFNLEATLGGGAIDITAAGSGRLAKVLPKTITQNDTPQFAGGNLIIKED